VHIARTARIQGRSRSELSVILTLAVQAGFDWVSYEDEDYCRVSVIPDGKLHVFTVPINHIY